MFEALVGVPAQAGSVRDVLLAPRLRNSSTVHVLTQRGDVGSPSRLSVHRPSVNKKCAKYGLTRVA